MSERARQPDTAREQRNEIRIPITEKQLNQRLDVAIAASESALSRSQAKNLIEQGHVRVNGVKVTKVSLAMEVGQVIEIHIPAPKKMDLTPQDVGIRILFEDESLAVLEKPAGISVHPSATDQGPTVVHGLLKSLETLSSVGGTERPGIVHRIDKGTSGILVVSKTDAAHLGLSQQFKEHTIDRRYRALVYGEIAKKECKRKGSIETFYGRHAVHRKKMTGKLTSGRKAITHWSVIKEYEGVTLLECKLETGRTHQIRVHLSEMGYPLIGDQLYGDNERKAKVLSRVSSELSRACMELNHQLLHACVLGFEHPVTHKKMHFESEVPSDFEKVMQLLVK